MYNKVQALGILKKFRKGVLAYSGKAPDCGMGENFVVWQHQNLYKSNFIMLLKFGIMPKTEYSKRVFNGSL